MKIMIFIKIAWRNILRNKRRTMITITAISFGLASLIYFGAINDGFNEQMVRSSVGLMMGHIQIHQKGYHDEPGVEKFISRPQRYLEKLRDLPYDIKYAPRVKIQGLISSPENSSGIYILGIQPDAEAKVSTLKRGIIEGEYLAPGDTNSKSILIGKSVAKSLKVGLGNKVVVMTQASDGSLGAVALKVTGIFKTGIPDMDKGVAYIPIETAKELLAYKDAITEIVVSVDRAENVNAARNLILEKFSAIDPNAGASLEVLTWEEIAPDIVQLVKMNDISMYIILGILFAVVMLGIINTLLMSIFERMRELGIVMAIGTSPAYVVLMIILEAIFIGLIGIALGVALGVSITAYHGRTGIDFADYSEALSMFLAFDTILYPVLRLKTLSIFTLTVFFTTIMASVYPAIKAGRLKPVEAIHHV